MVSALAGLAPEREKEILAAVAAAQARSNARLALVVVPASDRYQLYPIVWGAALSLLSLFAIAIGVPQLDVRTTAIIVTAIFVVSSLVLEWRPLRMLVIPRHVKHEHAHQIARREFAVHILSNPDQNGGVLFFVSLAERYAEIIADRVLHAAAGQEAWDKIVADFTRCATEGRLAEGFIDGAKACGALLEKHRRKS